MINSAEKPVCTNNSEPTLREGYKERFLYSLFPCALLCFIYLFFGPLSLIHENANSFHISITQATPYYLAAFVLGSAGLAAVAALLRGPLLDGVLRVILWLGLASYIQRNMLNPDFGLLDGRAYPWQEYTGTALINIAIWLALLLAVGAAEVLLGKRWKKAACAVSAIVILMQTAALASYYIENAAHARAQVSEEQFQLLMEPAADVSADENVLFFIIDACSNNALNQMLAAYPDALDSFKDFTYYSNCAPTFYGTFPEVISTLTSSSAYDVNRPYSEFVTESWNSPEADAFYELLQERGYKTNIFMFSNLISQNYSDIKSKISNASNEDIHWIIQPLKMYKKIGMLTLWEYLPTGFKPAFFTTPSDYEGMAVLNSVDRSWWSDDLLSSVLRSEGLRVVEDNIFAFYHFPGAHQPYRLDENGNVSSTDTSLARQIRGNFAIVEEYLEQLREIGAYDNSTIIVMADHGDYNYVGSTASTSAAMFIKLRGESHEQTPVNDAPVTHLELLPTIAADVAPESTFDFGPALADISEDEVRERTLYRWVKLDEDTRAAFDSFYVFHYDGNINDLNDLNAPDEVLTLYDSYY